jgi:hypothetical protein
VRGGVFQRELRHVRRVGQGSEPKKSHFGLVSLKLTTTIGHETPARKCLPHLNEGLLSIFESFY